MVNSVVPVLPRGLELGLGLKTYMCTVCTISSFLLLFVVNKELMTSINRLKSTWKTPEDAAHELS